MYTPSCVLCLIVVKLYILTTKMSKRRQNYKTVIFSWPNHKKSSHLFDNNINIISLNVYKQRKLQTILHLPILYEYIATEKVRWPTWRKGIVITAKSWLCYPAIRQTVYRTHTSTFFLTVTLRIVYSPL